MIKIFVMDVDGTLTDGKVYIGNSGEIMKAFNVKDGLGIYKLHKYGIVPAIITGRTSDIVTERARELNITEIYQGIENKKEKLRELVEKYNCKLEEIAYVGDDENDIECMKMCGFSACPADAIETLKSIVNYVSKYPGGYGAVRDIIDCKILL